MPRCLPLALVATLVVVGAAHAQTLRWPSQGDPQTMDPHSQNESMTNMMNGQVYERLLSRDRHLKIVPGLATEWQQVSPLVWRAKLRPGVKFHDGATMTADDVVFSVLRAQRPNSQINNYAAGVSTPVKIDRAHGRVQAEGGEPIFLEHLDSLWVMSRPGAEEQGRAAARFRTRKSSTPRSTPTVPARYMLVSRAPGMGRSTSGTRTTGAGSTATSRTSSFAPIANDATGSAALVSGEDRRSSTRPARRRQAAQRPASR
jgi:peptide/nickel transport system substrate-binding protein